jgi:hypothetical protein
MQPDFSEQEWNLCGNMDPKKTSDYQSLQSIKTFENNEPSLTDFIYQQQDEW